MKDGDTLFGYPIKIGPVFPNKPNPVITLGTFKDWIVPMGTITVQVPDGMTEAEIVAWVESKTGMKATIKNEESDGQKTTARPQ
jgi:hypothetical protein